MSEEDIEWIQQEIRKKGRELRVLLFGIVLWVAAAVMILAAGFADTQLWRIERLVWACCGPLSSYRPTQKSARMPTWIRYSESKVSGSFVGSVNAVKL